jgi:site-specific recombinase XerD
MTKSELKIKLDDWKKDLKYNEKSEKTIITYTGDIQKFLDFIADDREITKDDLINYKIQLKEKDHLKESSISRKIISLNKFFSFCDIDFKIKNIKVQSKSTLENLLTEKELKGILKQCEQQKEPLIYLMVKTLALTGIRYNELQSVTVEACKEKKAKIDNKGKIREVPLEAGLCKDLLQFAKEQGITSGMIFITKHGTFIKNEQFTRKLKKVAGKAHFIRLSKVHPHSFRHFFALNLLETVNNNMAVVADILGHSSLETTRIYLKTSMKEQRNHIKEMTKKLNI